MNKKLSKIALDILGIILALICLSPVYIIIDIIYNSYKYSIHNSICIYGSMDVTKNKF